MKQTNDVLKNAFLFIKSSTIFKIVMIFEAYQCIDILLASSEQIYGLVGWQFPFFALFNYGQKGYWMFAAMVIAFYVLPIEMGNAGLLFSRGCSRGRWFAEKYLITLIAFIILILTQIILETLCVTIGHGFRLPEEMKDRYVPSLLIYLLVVLVFYNLYLSVHVLIGTLLKRSIWIVIVSIPVTLVDYYIYNVWGESGKPVKHILGYLASRSAYLRSAVTSGRILQLDFFEGVIVELVVSIILIIISLNMFKRSDL